MFGLSNKKGEVQEEVLLLLMLSNISILSLYENISFLLVDDTMMENTFLLDKVIVK